MTFEELGNANERVDRHRYSPTEWLERHELVCREAVKHGFRGMSLIAAKVFQRSSDDRNLGLAFDHVAATSGMTPGVDGMTVEMIGLKNKWTLVRALRDDIRNDEYRHGKTRVVRMPKKSGNGFRRIHVPTFEDRIVQRAMVQAMQPLLDAQFLENSFGYRPAQGRIDAIAAAEMFFEEGRTVVVAEDLKDAFESVPQERLLAILRKHINEPLFMNLVERVVRTSRRVGIRQGGALSPLLLNLFLHHTVDRVWHRKHGSVPLIRYADDLALFCRRGSEAPGARAAIQEIVLSAGFQLKTSSISTTRDVTRYGWEWLGFELRWAAGTFNVQIGEAAWRSLQMQMERSVKVNNSSSGLPRLLRAWLEQMGVAYSDEHVDLVRCRINDLLATVGAKLVWKLHDFRARWFRSHTRWCDRRQLVRTRRCLVQDEDVTRPARRAASPTPTSRPATRRSI